MEKSMVNNIEQIENGLPSDKIIVLKSLYKTKSSKMTIQPAWSKRLSWFKGVPRLSEMDKQKMTFFITPDSKLVLQNEMEFNLADEVDAANWAWVKHSPRIAEDLDKAQMTPGAMFYIYMEEKEAQANISKSELLFKALQYVMTDKPVNYISRARLLGIDMTNDKPLIIKEFLISETTKHPEKVIEVYESDALAIQLLFYGAVDKGIITNDGQVFLYGRHVLGISEALSIEYLKEPRNTSLLDLLDRELHPEYFQAPSSAKPVSKTAKKTIKK
jgi:hypothetical protein